MAGVKKLYEYRSEDGTKILEYIRQELDVGHLSGVNRYLHPKLVRVRRGCAVWNIGGHDYTVRAGDVVLLSSTEQRAFREIYPPECFEMDYIIFSPLILASGIHLVGVLYRRGFHVVPRDSACFPDVIDCFERIEREVSSDAPYREIAAAALLTELLVAINRAAASSGVLPDGMIAPGSYTMVSKAVAYIHTHFTESITEGDLASRLYVTRTHLSRQFYNCLGIGFAEYLRRVRLQKTLELLCAHPSMNVLDAALDCGFGSSAGFYKTVRELTGTSPRMLLKTSEETLFGLIL
ncbi:MAG: helix-turn-helix transcriptional regulator [Clostridia bacterium]|nr:helix-turn-helix transcriptional regulator [Clostridia bacterium]